MNTKITALTLAAATAFAFTPKQASAGDGDGAAIFGAILGGAIIGAAIASADNCAPVYVDTYCPPAPVIYTPAPVVYAPTPVVYGGYWNTTTVNVWVPGAWVVERDYYGRDCRRYVAGHYAPRHNRVWVANNRYDNRGGNHHREVSRGHGNDRRDDHRDGRGNGGRDNRRDRR